MILADKIINERKKNGWSQEELADKLGVSRQAVSKWESAQSIPDLKRIIQMAQVFNVSTDYLLLDEIESVSQVDTLDRCEETNDFILVSIEEANEFIDFRQKNSNIFAGAVALCIISPTLLIFLIGLTQSKRIGIQEEVASGMGVIFMLILIALCVFYFIQYGIQSKKYEYMEKEKIETEYGVTNIVKDKERQFEPSYLMGMGIGVVLCILSPVPLIGFTCLQVANYVYTSLTSLLLILVAIGVFSIVRVSLIKGCYQILLEEGDYGVLNKKERKKLEPFDTIYWCLVTAGYLAWSFLTMKWHQTWIVWPVAGVSFAAIRVICSLFVNREK